MQVTVGTLWKAPNSIWDNYFASNKNRKDCHPIIVGKLSSDSLKCHIIPGTTKKYQRESYVFKTKINLTDPNCPISYFLIKLWMTYTIGDLLQLKKGWNGIDLLNESQIKDMKLKIRFCHGIDV